MPIEDIDFLGDNSELESTLFFLDSDSRDRRSFPSPSEYVVQFSEPIKLVVGLDILDATIPATMYVIDTHSESLSVTMLSAPAEVSASGGAEAQAFLSTLVTTSSPVSVAMSSLGVTTLYCKLYHYDYSDSNVNAGLGQPIASCNSSTPSLFFTVICNPAVGTYTSYAFPSAEAMDSATASTLLSLQVSLRKAVIILEHGNYDISSLMTHVSVSLKAVATLKLTWMDEKFTNFDVVSPSSSTVSLQGRYAVINYTYPFMLDMADAVSTTATVLGFDTLPSSDSGGYRCTASMPHGFGSVSSASVPTSLFSSTSFKTAPVHIVIAPGIANLLGVRYITLRCPEIEQHLYSGMTYGSHSTGLGVFKMVGGNEVSNLRFDFVSLVRRPFHPIGRLSRLTLRFERSDGVLYDFKGINTQLLIAVKFLCPGKRVPLTCSVLNPDYDPDYLRYTLRQTENATNRDSFGLLPSNAPYADADPDASDDVAEEEFDEAVMRRREIAQKLLRGQFKYDYPAAEADISSYRTVS